MLQFWITLVLQLEREGALHLARLRLIYIGFSEIHVNPGEKLELMFWDDSDCRMGDLRKVKKNEAY